jgi:hypothetical protein
MEKNERKKLCDGARRESLGASLNEADEKLSFQ